MAAAATARWQVRFCGSSGAAVRRLAGHVFILRRSACIMHCSLCCSLNPVLRMACFADAAKQGAIISSSLDSAMELLSGPEYDGRLETVFVIGGGQVRGWHGAGRAAALQQCRRLPGNAWKSICCLLHARPGWLGQH